MKESQPMGIGEIGKPSTVFVRKFRWTLSGKKLSESFVQKVAFDFVARTVAFEVIEAWTPEKGIEIQSWLESNLSNEVLTFTTYDGCGKSIYQYEINKITLLANKSDFDYESSEVSTRKIVIFYENIIRSELMETYKQSAPETYKQSAPETYKQSAPETYKQSAPKHCVNFDDTKGLPCTIQAIGSRIEIPIKVIRPEIEIEETEINFLNSKIYVPGKVKWKEIELIFHGHIEKSLFKHKLSQCDDFRISYWCPNTETKLESWLLKNCTVVMSGTNELMAKIYCQTITYQVENADGCGLFNANKHE
jgi:hypothetical protein